jgi:hypothetical protein
MRPRPMSLMGQYFACRLPSCHGRSPSDSCRISPRVATHPPCQPDYAAQHISESTTAFERRLTVTRGVARPVAQSIGDGESSRQVANVHCCARASRVSPPSKARKGPRIIASR